MTPEEEVTAQYRLRLALIACRAAVEGRDRLIVDAVRGGLPMSEVARLLGVSRSTVSGVVNGR